MVKPFEAGERVTWTTTARGKEKRHTGVVMAGLFDGCVYVREDGKEFSAYVRAFKLSRCRKVAQKGGATD